MAAKRGSGQRGLICMENKVWRGESQGVREAAPPVLVQVSLKWPYCHKMDYDSLIYYYLRPPDPISPNRNLMSR
ncbi:hypothetical protein NQZ68_002734 [Dissostichus eleginoides]|nr:hypothetical protein NQZ68_002734 [Dissostichus eleginoides]